MSRKNQDRTYLRQYYCVGCGSTTQRSIFSDRELKCSKCGSRLKEGHGSIKEDAKLAKARKELEEQECH